MPNDLTPPTTPQNGAPLGTLAKSVHTAPLSPLPKYQQNRAEAFTLQRTAAAILRRERVGKCMWSMCDLSSGVRVLRRETRARFDGLQTCGSVWMCPVCSARISETRRRELNAALSQARALNLSPVLITLTTRHKADDDLPTLLASLKAAKQHWHKSRTYHAHKPLIAGVITATEVTFGIANGWHPHLHLLAFLRLPGGVDHIITQNRIHQDLRAQWLTSLEASGLSGNGAAFDLQSGDAAGQYVAKWGAAEELALSSKKGTPDKAAKTTGYHPFDLLRQAAYLAKARALFFDYATAFKGRRQLQWTPGLRQLLAVPEVSDEEAAAPPAFDNLDEWMASISREDWPALRVKGRARILEAAEAATDLLDSLPDALNAMLLEPDDQR